MSKQQADPDQELRGIKERDREKRQARDAYEAERLRLERERDRILQPLDALRRSGPPGNRMADGDWLDALDKVRSALEEAGKVDLLNKLPKSGRARRFTHRCCDLLAAGQRTKALDLLDIEPGELDRELQWERTVDFPDDLRRLLNSLMPEPPDVRRLWRVAQALEKEIQDEIPYMDEVRTSEAIRNGYLELCENAAALKNPPPRGEGLLARPDLLSSEMRDWLFWVERELNRRHHEGTAGEQQPDSSDAEPMNTPGGGEADQQPNPSTRPELELTAPRRLLNGWHEITAALEMEYRDRRKIKSLNNRLAGPIMNDGRGTQPKVYRDDLIAWWNTMALRHQERVNQREGRKLSAEAQHNYGRNGTAAPEIGGGVKKRRRDKQT